MQKLPNLTIPQLAVLFLVLGVGSAAFWGLPVGAQDQPTDPPANPAENAPATPPQTEAPPTEAAPAPATTAPAKPMGTPQDLLQEARKQLLGRTFRARISQRIVFENRTLEATGRYLRGKDFQMRLEFRVESGATVGELLQVCNGDLLWTQRSVNGQIQLTRQDIKQILNTSAQTNALPQNIVIAELGLGGIPSLLASLERTMTFDPPRIERMDQEELRVLDGSWNETFKAQIKANPQLAKGLPEHFPDAARVYLDENDFPRRIQYLKKDAELDTLRPLLTLDFLDVEWLTEADLNAADFQYQKPAGVFENEVTDKYLKLLQPAPATAP